jgi:hypothetical protein
VPNQAPFASLDETNLLDRAFTPCLMGEATIRLPVQLQKHHFSM